MDHRLKSAIQWALSIAPGGMRLNDRLQRTRNSLPDWYHEAKIDKIQELIPGAPPKIAVEIGAGWDLLMALALRYSGCASVHCIDIHPHLDAIRIRQSLERLHARGIGPNVMGEPTGHVSLPKLVEHLQTTHGIRYQAPADARATDYAEHSVDLVYTYHVFEHVPEEAIAAIHRETLRILKPGGMAIHWIDLQDHWAYSGSGQGIHGFLAHGPLAWKLFNPPIHYQNRLRAPDHIRLMGDAGFAKLDTRIDEATPEQIQQLNKPRAIHSSVRRGMSLEQLGAREIRIVAIK